MEKLEEIKKLAEIPMTDDNETRRVEIVMLKFKEDWEVIGEAIKRIIQHTNWPFKLTVFDNRLNTANTSRAWNKLVKESTCDYVMLIDSDSFVPENLTPCWLTRMMESIDETGLVIPVSDVSGGQGQHIGKQEAYPNFVRNKGIWSGYCFLFKKSLYKTLGDFDERFYLYGQDSEWAHRSKKTGGAVMRKDVLVKHLGGYSMEKNDNKSSDKIYARKLFEYLCQSN